MPDIFPADVLYALLDPRYRGEFGYATLAELTAAAASHTEGVIIWVTNDPVLSNNIPYRKEGLGWVAVEFDLSGIVGNLTARLNQIETNELSYGDRTLSPRTGYAYIIRDSANKIALGVRNDGTVDDQFSSSSRPELET